jgi:hypothetical protein
MSDSSIDEAILVSDKLFAYLRSSKPRRTPPPSQELSDGAADGSSRHDSHEPVKRLPDVSEQDYQPHDPSEE